MRERENTKTSWSTNVCPDAQNAHTNWGL